LLGPGAWEAVRFASRVVADPAHAVGLWRAVTGGKAAGCLSPMPVPEILHAAGVLPVQLADEPFSRAVRSLMDAWISDPNRTPSNDIAGEKPRFGFPAGPFPDPASTLDLLESLAEWAGFLSGRPPTADSLWKSIRAFREREDLLRLLQDRGGGWDRSLPEGDAADLVRAGSFLPPESHSRLLATVLRFSRPAEPVYPEEEKGDPLLVLSLRLKMSRAGGEP